MNDTTQQLTKSLPPKLWRFGSGLSSRVLGLMIAVVMLAEIAIYLPSIANFRTAWINDRLASAYIAALVLEATPADMVPPELSKQLLDSVGAKMIVIKIHNRRRLLAISDMPPMVDETYDVRHASMIDAMTASTRALLAPAGRMLNIIGPAPMGGDSIEIVIEEAGLLAAMHAYSLNILVVSLLVSLIVGALAVLALHISILRPVARLTSNIMRFEANPEDASRIITPSGQSHEIGRAEQALRSMQIALLRELNQKKHLAALGLAVAKINHDLRNMLTSAQLLTDRLASAPDPLTQRLAPKLVGTLDRAIRFCQSTLAYGKAVDDPPVLRRIRLMPLVDEAIEAVSPFGRLPGAERKALDISNDVSEALELRADSEQLFRVVTNLLRNAVEALEASGAADGGTPHIKVRAKKTPEAIVIEVADNGPGIPAAIRPHLFAAFQGSNRIGGSGLGLAIAADLIRAHGGVIKLRKQGPQEHGATFRIVLPPA